MTIPLIDAVAPATARIIGTDQVGAVRCSPSRCVAARALLRRRGVLDAKVANRSARIRTRRGWVRYDLSAATAAAIRAYDEAGAMLPVGFVVELLVPARPLGSRAGRPSGSDVRSGTGASIASRRPSPRSLYREPTAA